MGQMKDLQMDIVADIEKAGHDPLAVLSYSANHGYTFANWSEWITEFEESFQVESSTADFAQEIADEMLTAYPQFVTTYFDYDKFERDLFLGDYWESNGFIFRSI